MSKRKKQKKQYKPRYCFISFMKEEFEFYYGPGQVESCSEALEKLKEDMTFIAEKMDYKYEDIYIGCINYAEREVIKLWSD